MKKIIAINGSPRRNGNTAKMLKAALAGAEAYGAEGEFIQLYSLFYKGCASCFYCKQKKKIHGNICATKDDLTPVLEKIKEADALILGTPIYFMNYSSSMVAFLERFLFSNYLYRFPDSSIFPKKLPSALFYTMNATEEQADLFHLPDRTKAYEEFLGNILGVPPKVLSAYNTLQFRDYSRYEASIFSEEDKKAYEKEHFQDTLDQARFIGIKLIGG